MTTTAVFFDVGETLVSEARLWAGWAAYLGFEFEAFNAALDDVIAKGEHHRRVFERLRPGLDVEAARRERARRGDVDLFDAADLYPDALPCLRRLRQLGYLVGIAGNQPRGAEAALRKLGFEADVVASSSSWAVEKPSPAFFAKIREAAGVPAAAIAYVGDRLDNDVLPARQAGMVAVFIERGPWGRNHARRAEIVQADIIISGLDELPEALTKLRQPGA
jgi:HAD superfamily hydrolase (TIGR01549 family)